MLALIMAINKIYDYILCFSSLKHCDSAMLNRCLQIDVNLLTVLDAEEKTKIVNVCQ